MIDEGAPRVVEYNIRFGDPEAQVVLPLINNVSDLLMSAAQGRVLDAVVTPRYTAACCVVLASEGYPRTYQKGFPITGLDNVSQDNVSQDGVYVFHAGTKEEGSQIVTSGGRVLGVTGFSVLDNPEQAFRQAQGKAYQEVPKLRLEGSRFHYRTDIGDKALHHFS